MIWFSHKCLVKRPKKSRCIRATTRDAPASTNFSSPSLHNLIYRAQSTENRVQSTEYRVQSTEYRVQTLQVRLLVAAWATMVALPVAVWPWWTTQGKSSHWSNSILWMSTLLPTRAISIKTNLYSHIDEIVGYMEWQGSQISNQNCGEIICSTI